jgi:hypothetical protein
VRENLIEMGSVDFDDWRKMGTGTRGENAAAEQLEALFDKGAPEDKEPSIKL